MSWSREFVGSALHVYENLDALRAKQVLFKTVVPETGRTYFSGVYCDEVFPSQIAGVVTVGDPTNALVSVFQLAWDSPRTLSQCGAALGAEYVFSSASDSFDRGEPVPLLPLRITTLSLRDSEGSAVALNADALPWRWVLHCKVQAAFPEVRDGAADFSDLVAKALK
jgi:hypothetical protein